MNRNGYGMAGRATLAVLALSFAISSASFAQDGYPRSRSHTIPGRPTIDIYVLGATDARGPWTVTEGISFIELISVLLPEGLGTVPEDIVQKATMDIYRSTDVGTELVYSEDLRAVLRGESPSPVLRNEDTVVFENLTRPRRRITFRSVVSNVGAISSLVLLYLRVRQAL